MTSTKQDTNNSGEKLEFQAEVKQLMQLMIHSLYSNKEIVLRELISNASDAADKLRFEALANGALYENDSDLKITIGFDKAKRTITISDNGIGMSREEVIANIGTIAKSGTKEFFNSLTGDQAKVNRNIVGRIRENIIRNVARAVFTQRKSDWIWNHHHLTCRIIAIRNI